MMGKEKLENGGKTRLNIEYPMLFELSGSQGRVTHCGVLEFVADEGLCYLPHWMMQQLLLTEGQLINVKSATLPKGTYTKLQPVDETFLDLTNPKAVLENALRNWSALTAGDVIIINYNKKNYEINVLEVKPDTPSHAISIIEADVMVDFAPSEDQLKKAEQARRQQLEKAAVSSIKGKGKATEKEAPGAKPAEPEPEVPKPSFPGSGFRLDGRSITKPAADSTRKPGGLVFGAGNTAAAAASAKANAPAASKDQGKKKEEEKKPAPQEEKKFVPFSGAGYSLRG
ncbi:Ubiquitin fusion degradation protein 1, putative [Acanthamoeba castellanii str. Neff]|uniref:Ubiquitin fusion degradation protein 1, putative n=1 Tax=Acanthamoeba castellanii (strain ATCC 30010 / Neff) TaxID=1257118 RepID=L8GY51_ACACF|nr:Ubiquitin fusion degradation protein 1, putative [Acanthamoeba castellanii str. Neff]ELR17478.1 Ubiquitin fusion degradation protein 1, putative [Acanthamoeba castellanii str. Neff]